MAACKRAPQGSDRRQQKLVRPLICAGIVAEECPGAPTAPAGESIETWAYLLWAAKEAVGLWNSLARPDQAENTSAAREKCPRHVRHLSKNCNETISPDCPPLGLRMAKSDRKRREPQHHHRHVRSPSMNLQCESHRSIWAMMVPFVSQEARPKRGRSHGN